MNHWGEGSVENGENVHVGGQGYMEISVLPFQFCCAPKIAPKIVYIFKKFMMNKCLYRLSLRKPLTRLTDLSFLKAPRKKYIYWFSNLIIFAVKFSIKTKFSLAEKIHNQCLCKTQKF